MNIVRGVIIAFLFYCLGAYAGARMERQNCQQGGQP